MRLKETGVQFAHNRRYFRSDFKSAPAAEPVVVTPADLTAYLVFGAKA